MTAVTSDKPYRIQTNAGHRKYLCSGLYMPSVTTVLSGTESEKSKAGLRNGKRRTQENWKLLLLAALLFTLAVKTIYVDCRQMFLKNINRFGMV